MGLKFHKWTDLSWSWSHLLDHLLKNNATLLITLDSFSLSFPHWKPKNKPIDCDQMVTVIHDSENMSIDIL